VSQARTLVIGEPVIAQLTGLERSGARTKIMDQVRRLQKSPEPDGQNRKPLKGPNKLLRCRVGDYRLIYAYDDQFLELLEVVHRKDAYEDLEQLEASRVDTSAWAGTEYESGDAGHEDASFVQIPEVGKSLDPALPVPITKELLQRLNVETVYHHPLMQCSTLEELCRCWIPEDLRDWVFDAVCDPDPSWLVQQKQYVVEDLNELERVLSGEFVKFLLKLDDEQSRIVEEFSARGGPALVTGGPGSGKSVVAIYSAKALLRKLQADGVSSPRILVTTFTNALREAIRQELQEILGSDLRYMTVKTLDQVAREIWVSSAPANQGTRVMISQNQWPSVRRRALEMVTSGEWRQRFDAVIVDEAQDLYPDAFKLALQLSSKPELLMVTADSDQTLYEGRLSFSETDLSNFNHWHLSTAHRTTRDIMRAASFYFTGEDSSQQQPDTEKYGFKPAHRLVADSDREAQLISEYFGWATLQHRTGYGSCAVLVPSNQAGELVAERLRSKGIDARFMKSNELDLTYRNVKVMTLHAAKGLEFTCVAIAGLFDASSWGSNNQHLERSRRVLYVGMTRAMRMVLFVQPANDDRPIFSRIDSNLWNSREYGFEADDTEVGPAAGD
jgi:mRNA-degrading endonuclease RelE of RelBE toxin-antitoxin system/ribonucleotide monophosphatase NagD (HAD superfamily)